MPGLSRLNLNRNLDLNSNWNDDNLANSNGDGRMTQHSRVLFMKTHKNLYWRICSLSNLILAWKKARKGKTTRDYVIKFESNLSHNLIKLHEELRTQIYLPEPLKTFTLRDPKTRKISKSAFRDRVVHHAIVNVLEPIFDKTFIHDSCANRKGKGNLYALKRFDKFRRKVSGNGMIVADRLNNLNYIRGYCLKADIKHYFQEVNHEILMNILSNKIGDELTIILIKKILNNNSSGGGGGRPTPRGMPLGNLTSQFFANIYLNELDYFVKHQLKSKYYIRYVNDFVLLHHSREQLEIWKKDIEVFLRESLKLELHPDKSKIIPLAEGIDFVGFRNFYHFKLLRKRNIRKMDSKIECFAHGGTEYWTLIHSFQGWNAYAKWANTYRLRKKFVKNINKIRAEINKEARRTPANLSNVPIS